MKNHLYVALIIAASLLCAAVFSCSKPRYNVEPYRTVIRSDPDDADRQFNLGVALAILDRNEEAVQSFTEAVRLAPDDAEAYFRLGMAQYNFNRMGEAADAFRKSFAAGHVETLHYNRGIAFYLCGRHTDAESEYRHSIIDDEPHPARTMCNLGALYILMNKPEQAIETLETVIRTDTAMAEEYDPFAYLALAYLMTKQHDKAAAMFDRSLEINPDNPDVLFNKALFMIEACDLSGAMVVLERLQKLDAGKAARLSQRIRDALPVNSPVDEH